MNISNILSISGMPGLYRMITNKKSGLVVESLNGGRSQFISARQHQFTPLESISIYTDDGDSVMIKEVLQRMMDTHDDLPKPDPKAPKEDLREYFLDLLPNHDQERVYTSDISKLLKWYAQLDSSGALAAEDNAVESSAPAQEEEDKA